MTETYSVGQRDDLSDSDFSVLPVVYFLLFVASCNSFISFIYFQ